MGTDLTYYSAMGKVRRQFFLERRSSHGTGLHALRWDLGGGLSCSPDGGMTWNRIRNPIPSECNVRALAVYSDDPHRILAGTDVGILS